MYMWFHKYAIINYVQEQLDDDSMYCMGEDICTSKCGCTDGTNFTTDSQTTRVFDQSDVKYQGEN